MAIFKNSFSVLLAGVLSPPYGVQSETFVSRIPTLGLFMSALASAAAKFACARWSAGLINLLHCHLIPEVASPACSGMVTSALSAVGSAAFLTNGSSQQAPPNPIPVV